MSCYHPNRLFKVNVQDGKCRVKVLPYDYKWIDERGVAHKGDMPKGENGNDVSFLIPCGKCIGCRKDQSKEWSSRLIMEMLYHDSSYFVTLTYDNDHVHKVLDPETNCPNGFMTLDKRDCQLFMKLLRKKRPNDTLKFYLAGEYGPRTLRPHYHMIIFGLHLNDWHLVPCGKSETGNQYFVCPEIEEVWNRGFVSVEPANEYTCKYVANYVTKKLGNKPNKVYTDQGMEPPFSLSSRRPGIGFQFAQDNKDKILNYDTIQISLESGSYSCKVPRYLKKKVFESGSGSAASEYFMDLADHRFLVANKKGDDKIDFLESLSDKDYLSSLSDMEKLSHERTGKRDKI